MGKRLVVFGCGVACFFFFVFFSYLVHENLFTQLDFDTTVRIQDNLTRRVDTLFSFLSMTGGFEIATISLLIVFVLRRKLAGIVAFAAYGIFHLIEVFGKTFVDHAPPPEFMLRTERLGDFPQFHVRAEFSYPSGHSGRAAFLSILLGFFIWKSKKLSQSQKLLFLFFLACYDFAMFVSRVYLGEHWLSDVLGGILLGLAMALMSEAFFAF